MAKQMPGQEQRAQQHTQERPPAERPPERSKHTAEHAGGMVEPANAAVQDIAANAKQKPAVELAERKLTAGRAGERNLAIEWINVAVGLNMSARFNVKTLSGNALEVTLQQNEYKKIFAGQGAVSTTVIPSAPIGTSGKLIVRDITTGEVLEQPWTWRLLGKWSIGAKGGFWAAIKRFLGFD